MDMITIEQATAIAKAELERIHGGTFAQLVERVRAEAGADGYGSLIAGRQVKLFYTANPNYANGRANGYGAGVYLVLRAINGSRTIRIAN